MSVWCVYIFFTSIVVWGVLLSINDLLLLIKPKFYVSSFNPFTANNIYLQINPNNLSSYFPLTDLMAMETVKPHDHLIIPLAAEWAELFKNCQMLLCIGLVLHQRTSEISSTSYKTLNWATWPGSVTLVWSLALSPVPEMYRTEFFFYCVFYCCRVCLLN